MYLDDNNRLSILCFCQLIFRCFMGVYCKIAFCVAEIKTRKLYHREEFPGLVDSCDLLPVELSHHCHLGWIQLLIRCYQSVKVGKPVSVWENGRWRTVRQLWKKTCHDYKVILNTWPRGYKTKVQSQTQNKAQWLAACGHMSASSQSLHFILSLRMNSSL